MMKYILSLILFLSASVSQAYVCDRLDIMGSNGLIQSFMVDDINKFTYLKDDPASDVYTTLHIELVTGATYDFSMAEIASIMYQGVSSDYLEIKCESDPHAPIVMLDCINNDHLMGADKPLNWTGDKPNGKPHFDVRPEPGYVHELEIVGQLTGNVYSDIEGFVFLDVKENNLLGIDAWAFYMPNEPVVIRSTSMELNTYLGCDFLGKYTGYEYTAANGLIDRDNIPPLSMELKANGTCHIKSDDAMKYNFVDVFEYKQGSNGFTHYVEPKEDDEEGADLELRDQPTYGVNGTFLVNDYIVISIHDYNQDRHENTRIYVTGKKPFTYIGAFRTGDAYKGLLEMKDQDTGELTHVWMDNYGYISKVATLTFKKGTSIGETSEAMISVDGQTIAKYTYVSGNEEPTITMQGKEAGYYLPKGSEAGSIYFDGFGTVEIDGKEYSYVMESGVATVDYNGQQRVFILDMNAMTYTEQVVDKWEGPSKYINEKVLGCFEGGSEVAKQKVYLYMDQNLMGKEKPGYAALDIQIYGDTKYYSAVADCQKYIYNASDNTITLTTVLAGTGHRGTNRMTFVFQLSADKKTAWLKDTGAGQRIYSTSDNSYVVLNQANALVAPEVKMPELADVYTATYNGTSGETQIKVAGKLLIDQDANGGKKAGYATLICSADGKDLINSCVPYVLGETKLTLKGVKVGDGNGGTKTTDVVFTVTEDGRILGRETYYGVTGGMNVDLTTASLVPEIADAQLAKKYTGDFYLGASGYEAEVPSIVGTLYIDSTAEGILQAGYATLDLRLNGAKFMSASAPYELVDNKLILKNFGVKDTDSADLVFEIGADGSLQATGKVYGTYSYASCYVNMAKTKMTPVKD
ncbi:MAG: hypothetical protein II199_06545 [Bacteroidaceae bacterium]|nr:hypothetical protein [Bacteroidaceae bacterium]